MTDIYRFSDVAYQCTRGKADGQRRTVGYHVSSRVVGICSTIERQRNSESRSIVDCLSPILHLALEVEVGVETAATGTRCMLLFHGSRKDRVTSHLGKVY